MPARPSVARRAVSVSSESLVTVGKLPGHERMPALITSSFPAFRLDLWASSNSKYLEELLIQFGALLFRGFDLPGPDEFDRFARSVTDVMKYRERSSPRSEIIRNIYTSTDYPHDQHIFPHNEHSYAHEFPLKLFFYCQLPADTGGQTPIADIRRITHRIDPAIRRRFAEKGWMWVRNFGHGFGLPWQTVFDTSDKQQVLEYCNAHAIAAEWNGEKLRTRQVRPAMIQHPRTGEWLWFNHATFFHVTTLDPLMTEHLTANFGPDELPNNTFYGDGAPIEDSVLKELREAYLAECTVFDWERSDVLLIDNVLTAHARRSYTGPRKVLVAMGDAFQRTDIALPFRLDCT